MKDAIFFKLKPAVMEVVICIILGISAFTPAEIIQKMTLRRMKGISLNDNARKKLRQSMAVMCAVFFVHSILIIFAALFYSEAIWGFVSGPLLYIFFGIYFCIVLLKNRYRRKRYVPTSSSADKVKRG